MDWKAGASGGDLVGEAGRLSGFNSAAAPFGTVLRSARFTSHRRGGIGLGDVQPEGGVENSHDSATGEYPRGVSQTVLVLAVLVWMLILVWAVHR